MEVNPLAAQAASKATQSSTKLAETFDTFLGLLTAQLKNQDPLDPLDSAQFTEQLVMFSSAEQSIAGNKNLETLIELFNSGNASNSVNYLGKTITAEGDEAVLSNGAASWQYTLDGNSAQTVVSIANANGNDWDGKNTQGLPQPDGLYTITITAKDINGQSVASTTTMEGVVSGIESLDDGAVLSVNGVKIPTAKIVAVKQTEQPTTEQPTPPPPEQ